ncbi:chitobiase/beta-hexosaminidase C-terminal domain-containing protein [Candidatus Peregrinibacteria bacterium]|nr:MAG: chitobiase/beta-hexosaminidase C-terminal domain-containing protein [Candidatus Peregrinibacteria bacterium]
MDRHRHTLLFHACFKPVTMFTMNRIFHRIVGLVFVFLLLPTLGFAYCGDTILQVDEGEQCDDGNFVNRDGCSSYCKFEDMTPPSVVESSITENAEAISTVLDYFRVTFSEPVDPKSIDAYSVRLVSGPKEVAMGRELSEDGLRVLLQLQEELDPDETYAVRVVGVRDLVGNVMNVEFVRPFTTEPAVDRNPPNLVAYPDSGLYHFPQNLELKAYVGAYTKSDDFLDEGAIIYYTINGNIPTKANAEIYKQPLRISEESTVRFFGIDAAGNVSDVQTKDYTFDCNPAEHYKEREAYPSCKIITCDRGYKLQSGTCIVDNRTTGDALDYELDAATAPLFSSATPLTISTKPAILITAEHEGIIKRPIIFKDTKRNTELLFERDTGIRHLLTGEPYAGYIIPPSNLYLKDFPINFGYSIKAIFEFKGPNGELLSFSPLIAFVSPTPMGLIRMTR